MSKSLDVALAFLTDPIVTKETIQKAPKEKKPRKAKVAKVKVQASPMPEVPAEPPPTFDPLPAAGTIDAREFMKRQARARDRDEVIECIAAFCGYDRQKDFSVQAMAAKLAAQRELNPVKAASKPYARGSAPIANGYMHGMPNHHEKAIQNLYADKRRAETERETFVLQARYGDSDKRVLHEGLAMVEEARIEHIDRDLDLLKGE